jgi:hypothetical protein
MSNDLVIIMCPPLSDYPEQPKDQSHCEIYDCPRCKGKMWLSEKKKGVLLFSAVAGKEILLACYDCIKRLAQEDPELFHDHEMVRL